MWSFISVPGTCQTGKNIVWNLWWFFSFFSIFFSVILWRAELNLSKQLIYYNNFVIIFSLILNFTLVPGTCFLKNNSCVSVLFPWKLLKMLSPHIRKFSDLCKVWNQKYYVIVYLEAFKLPELVKACPWDKMQKSHINTYLCLPILICII